MPLWREYQRVSLLSAKRAEDTFQEKLCQHEFFLGKNYDNSVLFIKPQILSERTLVACTIYVLDSYSDLHKQLTLIKQTNGLISGLCLSILGFGDNSLFLLLYWIPLLWHTGQLWSVFKRTNMAMIQWGSVYRSPNLCDLWSEMQLTVGSCVVGLGVPQGLELSLSCPPLGEPWELGPLNHLFSTLSPGLVWVWHIAGFRLKYLIS